MADPSNIFALDDLRILVKRDVRPVLATEEEIGKLIAQAGRLDQVVAQVVDQSDIPDAIADRSLDDITEGVDDAPVVRLVNSIISRGVQDGASDIHFEPQAREMVVRFRIDGVLRAITSVPFRFATGVASRIKIMADLDIAERRMPQDGRVGLSVGGRNLDLRVATLPTVYGEKIVIRVLDRSNVVMDLRDLGFAPDVLERYEACYRRPYGAVLVTGPTGSGKSTTLYGTLNQLNGVDRNIITVEDPVEYRLNGVNQVQVNPKAGLSFAAGLRSILRCDPDVVMIGEVRDRETAKIAVESALTGHLVLATLHTNDAAGALSRLSEMGVEPFLSASAVTGILAQRLARRLCTHCRQPHMVPTSVLRDMVEHDRLPAALPDRMQVHRAVGCSRCGGTGYRGRMGVYEMLVVSDAIQDMLVEGASTEAITKTAMAEGMRTLREDGLMRVMRGDTSLDELARAVG
jgi:type IV pilus assembly protein PilB